MKAKSMIAKENKEKKTINFHLIIALSIMMIALIGVFFTGFYFDLFGEKIDFSNNPATYLFFSFILLGVFGAFYTVFKAKFALFGTFIILLIYFVLFILGKISRGEI